MVWPSQSQPPALTQTVRRTAVPDIHAATIIERDAMAALLILMVRWFLAGVFLRAGVVKLRGSQLRAAAAAVRRASGGRAAAGRDRRRRAARDGDPHRAGGDPARLAAGRVRGGDRGQS